MKQMAAQNEMKNRTIWDVSRAEEKGYRLARYHSMGWNCSFLFDLRYNWTQLERYKNAGRFALKEGSWRLKSNHDENTCKK